MSLTVGFGGSNIPPTSYISPVGDEPPINEGGNQHRSLPPVKRKTVLKTFLGGSDFGESSILPTVAVLGLVIGLASMLIKGK